MFEGRYSIQHIDWIAKVSNVRLKNFELRFRNCPNFRYGRQGGSSVVISDFIILVRDSKDVVPKHHCIQVTEQVAAVWIGFIASRNCPHAGIDIVPGFDLHVPVFAHAIGVAAGGGVAIAIGVEVGSGLEASGVFLDEAQGRGGVVAAAVEIEAGFAVEFAAGPAVAQEEGAASGGIDGGAVEAVAPGGLPGAGAAGEAADAAQHVTGDVVVVGAAVLMDGDQVVDAQAPGVAEGEAGADAVGFGGYLAAGGMAELPLRVAIGTWRAPAGGWPAIFRASADALLFNP